MVAVIEAIDEAICKLQFLSKEQNLTTSLNLVVKHERDCHMGRDNGTAMRINFPVPIKKARPRTSIAWLGMDCGGQLSISTALRNQ